MKILAVSDIHGDLGLVKKVEKLIDKENVDLVILAGDQTWFEENTKNLVGPLTKKRALIIPSNHESNETLNMWESQYENLKNIHRKHHIEKDVGFFGTGTLEWGMKHSKSPIYEELKEPHKKIKHLKKKILITHEPPQGSKIELLGFPGSYGVRKAIDKFKPDFAFFGHIHEGAGLTEKIGKTTIMNVSRTPQIIEI